jgi:hypothetical protein
MFSIDFQDRHLVVSSSLKLNLVISVQEIKKIKNIRKGANPMDVDVAIGFDPVLLRNVLVGVAVEDGFAEEITEGETIGLNDPTPYRLKMDENS